MSKSTWKTKSLPNYIKTEIDSKWKSILNNKNNEQSIFEKKAELVQFIVDKYSPKFTVNNALAGKTFDFYFPNVIDNQIKNIG
jgi:hypothetical protein